MGARAAQGAAVIMVWLLQQFAACAVLIARAGYVLGISTHPLAEAHGWGRGWIGLALLATGNSRPEVASGMGAVAFGDAPKLTAGNAVGTSVVNLLFLVVVDALQRHQPMYREASATPLMSAAFGVVLLGSVALSLLTGTHAPALLYVGLHSLMLLALYRLALKGVHGHQRHAMATHTAMRCPVPAGQTREQWPTR